MAKKSLLLVDSDARSLRVLEVSLKKAGFAVATASSAADALQAALRSPPDLVISETQLPDNDGFEICRRLKADGRTSRACVVFLSSDARAEAKVKGINSGADDYLVKPVMVMEIVTRVRALLERRETEAIARRGERPGNLSGTLANMAVVDILQLMESGQKSGIVHVSSDSARSGGMVPQGEQRGTVYFREGRVVDAHVGKLTGANAVYRLLMWNDGVFEIEFKALARDDQVHISTQVLLLEGMRRIDEWSRLEATLPPLTTRFSVDFNALGARYQEVPDPMKPVLHLFDGKRSIFDVINEAGQDDITVLATIAELHRQGVLYHGDRTLTPQAESQPKFDPVSVEAWLTGGHAPATSRPAAPASSAPIPPASALPSVLGRAVIPSPVSASEILALPSSPDGSTGRPIPLTQPIRERTPEPEPVQDDQIILSRNTVPAPQAVPLTQPVARAIPKLRVQKVSSVIAKLSDVHKMEYEPTPAEDDWEPIKSEVATPVVMETQKSLASSLTSSAALPSPNGSNGARSSVITSSAVVASPATSSPSTPVGQFGAHPVPWPVAPIQPSVSTSSPPVTAEDQSRAPVRGPALVVAEKSAAPAAQPAPAAFTPPLSAPPPPAPASTPVPWATVPKKDPEPTIQARVSHTPAPATRTAASTSGLHDSFFDKHESTISGTWEPHSRNMRWTGPLLVVGVVLAVVGVAASLKFGSQTKLKAPEPPSKRSQLAKQKAAAWPKADEGAVRIGGEGEAVAVAQAQQPAAAQGTEPAQPVAQNGAQAQAAVPSAAQPVQQVQPQPAQQPAQQAAAVKPVEQPKVEVKKPEEKPAEKKPAPEAAKPVASAPTEATKASLAAAEGSLRSDKLKDAEKQFRAILEGNPDLPDAHSGLAMALYGMEKDGAAGAEAKKALALNNSSARAYLVLGLIASNKQDIKSAKQAYKRYLELEPSGEYSEEVRRFMKAQQ